MYPTIRILEEARVPELYVRLLLQSQAEHESQMHHVLGRHVPVVPANVGTNDTHQTSPSEVCTKRQHQLHAPNVHTKADTKL